MTAPKLFISYSWSDSEHEQWVLNLSTELRDSGVDVILDKWDLKEGHDAVAFMEQMVTNQEIKKVVIICDEEYAAKANGRAGGVGTETQIISKEVYENQAQEKFVAVVSQKDENGKPFLPIYYKSRIYIDLSEADRYADNFERLLRWIFDKPLYVKPEIGNKPSFLSEDEHISLGTAAMFKRCVDALKNNKGFAVGAFDEYCNTFALNLERFRLSNIKAEEYDEALVKNIEEFLPYRNEAIQLFITVAQYSPTIEFIQRIHRLFESLVPYMKRPEQITQYNEYDFDNFKFLVYELFLYTLAVLLKHDRFDQANVLLQQQYYIPGYSDYGRDVMASFVVFCENIDSLEYRNQRLGLRRVSLQADLLKERCSRTGIDFRYLMQADFIAFMRSEIENNNPYIRWWPYTMLYLGLINSPFEIFARSVSKVYFNRVKILFAINTPEELEPLFKSYQDGSRSLPKWNFHSFSPAALIGYKNLSTKP
jgi:hypothetical protein